MYNLCVTCKQVNIMDIVLNRLSARFTQKPIESTTYAHLRLGSCPHTPKVLTRWRGGSTPPSLGAAGAADGAP